MRNDTLAMTADRDSGDGLPVPRRYWAIASILIAIAMSVLDSTIVNVALPTITHDFQTTKAASIWIVNAYQIAILVALLPLSSLGEIVGYRRVSLAGLSVFTLASLMCAFAPSLTLLSIARVIQGLGAAGIMSVNAALVRFTYPRGMLGRAIGINAFVVATSAAIGPTIASGVLAVTDWRWLFAINIPLGIVAISIARAALPHTFRTPRRLNPIAVMLHVATFGLLLGGLQALAHHEATNLALVQVAAGLAAGIALARHELDRPAPLIPFDLLRIPMFSMSIATSICSFMAQAIAFVALPFEIQRLGHSAVETGLLMTPWPLALACAAPVAGHLADRYPAGILGGLGLMVMAAGLWFLASAPPSGNAGDLIWRMALVGFGFGFFQSPNNRAMIASAPQNRSGAAGGMQATARLLGQSLGAASVAIMFRANPAEGSNLALHAAAAVALVASVVSMIRLAAKQASHP